MSKTIIFNLKKKKKKNFSLTSTQTFNLHFVCYELQKQPDNFLIVITYEEPRYHISKMN